MPYKVVAFRLNEFILTKFFNSSEDFHKFLKKKVELHDDILAHLVITFPSS